MLERNPEMTFHKRGNIDVNYLEKLVASIEGIRENTVDVSEYKSEIEITFKLEDARDIPSSIVYDLEQEGVSVVLRLPYMEDIDEGKISGKLINKMRPNWMWVHTGEGREALHAEFDFEDVTAKDIYDILRRVEDGIKYVMEDYMENPSDIQDYLGGKYGPSTEPAPKDIYDIEWNNFPRDKSEVRKVIQLFWWCSETDNWEWFPFEEFVEKKKKSCCVIWSICSVKGSPKMLWR